MPRLPILSEAQYSDEQRRVHTSIREQSRGNHVGAPYHLALHAPQFLEKWADLGRLLRYGTSLPPHLSELAILVTARYWSCQYEWIAHAPHAQNAGLAKDVIEAIRLGKRPALADDAQEAVYLYARELHEKRTVEAATHERALRALGANGIVELTALLGHYATIAMMLNAHDYGLPEGEAPPLPPLS